LSRENKLQVQSLLTSFKDQADYLISIGVATKLASITLGAWQRPLSTAIAIPQRNTVTPVTNEIHECHTVSHLYLRELREL